MFIPKAMSVYVVDMDIFHYAEKLWHVGGSMKGQSTTKS